MQLSSEDLLAGTALEHEVIIPSALLAAPDDAQRTVRLHPLSVRDLQLIAKAAGEDETLSASLMLQRALVSPEMELAEVSRLPAGLARFLLDEINTISGIELPKNALAELVQAPLAKACFVLAREFGWTPEEVSGMTIGQILLFLEMSEDREKSA